MVESGETFLRCPSCRSLVPTVSTRCNVCGANLDAAGAWAGQDDATKRKRRARQHTASVQDPDQIAALKEAYSQGGSAAGYIDDPLSAYIEEVEVESKPKSAVDKADVLDGKVHEEVSVPGMLQPPPIVGSSVPSFSAPGQTAPTMLQPPLTPSSQLSKPMLDSDDADEDDEFDDGDAVETRGDGEARRRRRRSRRRRRGSGSDEQGSDEQGSDERGSNEGGSDGIGSVEQESSDAGSGDNTSSYASDAEEVVETLSTNSAEQSANDEIEVFSVDDDGIDEGKGVGSVNDEKVPDSARSTMQQHDAPIAKTAAAPAYSATSEPIRQSEKPKAMPAVRRSDGSNDEFNSPVAKENIMNAGAHAEFTPASDAKLYGWIISFDDPMGTGYELRESKFFITRAELKASDFVVRDASVSTPHALITVGSGGVWVQDLMSETGVSVRHVGESDYTDLAESANDRLFDGDWVKFGHKEFLITLIPYETT
jgi:hypothetical protein